MLSLKGTTCALILVLLVVVSGQALATEPPRTAVDPLAMTDEEAIAFANMASPNAALAGQARADNRITGTVTLIKYRPIMALPREAKPLKMHMATIDESPRFRSKSD